MDRICHWAETARGTAFTLNGEPAGLAEAAPGAKDTFALVEDGVVCWTRTADEPTERMTMRFVAPYRPLYQMVPAVQYDRNDCLFIQDYNEVRNSSLPEQERREEKTPTYFHGNTDPDTGEPWRLLWHRSSVPGATYSEGERLSTGLFLPPDQLDGACSLYPQGEETVHELLWPEQDSRLRLFAHPEEHVQKPRARRVFRAMLVFAPVTEPRYAWHALLSAAWKQYYTLKAPARSYEDLWKLGISYAKLLYTEEPDGFKGFSIGFTWEGKWVKRSTQKYEIGWCGQNASLANSLLAHARMTGDEDAKEKGLAVLDAWIQAQKPTGLIPTHYDDNLYTNGFGKTVDACNLGTAAMQFFEAENHAAALHCPRPQYGEMARRICDFALRVMDENGRIGKSWLEADLSPAVKQGTTGAFLTMALCEGARRTGSESYLEAAKKSCRYYSRELSENGYTTAGALDVFSIDKESGIPLLKGNLMLYRLTGEREFLKNAEKAAWYLSTWQWHYTRKYPDGSLLDTMGFDTFGGTAVSIHGGMDPFALCYVHEIRDLEELTGNVEWRQRANGIWRHGQMCISDGTLVVDGKDPRPAGSQDESVSVSIGAHHENSPSQWLVAWPTAFRLEALRRILPVFGDRHERVL